MPPPITLSRFPRRPSALPIAGALLAAAGAAAPVSGALISWNTVNGSWFNAANWTGGVVPNFGDDVRIGNLAGVQNGVVMGGLLPSFAADSLQITDGMTLDLNGGQYLSSGLVSVTGVNSRVIVRASAGPNPQDFNGRLSLGAGAFFEIRDNAPVRLYSSVGAQSVSSGVIAGRGSIVLFGDGPFRNEGVINPGNNGGLTIAQEDPVAGLFDIDLDGQTGDGQLLLASPFSELHVRAAGLSDGFSGVITMGSGSLLDIDLSEVWVADSTSVINVSSAIAGAAAQIAGSHVSLGGSLNIGGSEGHLRVLADATVGASADILIGEGDVLEFDGATAVHGANFDFGGGLAVVRFDGPTHVYGGTYTMDSSFITDGRVEFDGETTWDGIVNINGFGRQNGDATVIGTSVINADVFQMRGYNGDTTWNIKDRLTVNAHRIGLHAENYFGGTFDIGGPSGRLTINVDPGDPWVMDGVMNLAGVGALPVTRVAGSRMIVHGDLNVTGGIVQITADTSLIDGEVSIANGATLRMLGRTTVDSATTAFGAGVLENGPGGEMVLEPGVGLAVGLTNNGSFRIGEDEPGIALVHRFVSGADASWDVDVGGPGGGAGHDRLIVYGGSAALNGMLNVSLIDLGAGVFMPSVGDEFLLLTTFGGVSGKFINDPVSHVGALTYEWSVVYDASTVSLRLDNIVPAPGSVVLAGIGALIAAPRRRR